VGRHPIFAALNNEAATLAVEASPRLFRSQSTWNPFAFIDVSQECVERGSPSEPVCRAIQRREWELLFDFCYRAAVGEPAPSSQ
jgi:hypothetical protein